MRHSTWILATVMCAPNLARAEAPFFWMRDQVPATQLDLEFVAGNSATALGDAVVVTTDMVVGVDLGLGLGLSARMPLNISFFDSDVSGALGNLGIEFGVSKRIRDGGLTIRYGGSGLVYLPTVSDSGNEAIAASAGAALALPDPGRWMNATTVRGRGDFSISGTHLFLQAEANIDFHFSSASDDVDFTFGVGPGVSVNERLSFLAELSFVRVVDGATTVADIGLRYRNRDVTFAARAYIPTADVRGVGVDFTTRF